MRRRRRARRRSRTARRRAPTPAARPRSPPRRPSPPPAGGSRSRGAPPPPARARARRAALLLERRFEDGPVVLEIRGLERRNLADVVPAPQPHGVLRVRRALEVGHLLVAVRPALELEAEDRRGRQLVHVLRLDGAEVALRGNVHADRLRDLGPEVLRQERVRNLFVLRVDAVL